MKKNKTSLKVVVLGAGLSGLAAAFELSKAGFTVVVLEKDKQIGGLAKTITHNGFKFDTGPHRWYTKNNKVNLWMLNLLKKEIIRVPRLTRIYFDKKFFYYPIRLLNALSGIGVRKAFSAVSDYLLSRIRYRVFKPRLATMEDGYIMQFGKTLYETFFQRYSEKLWGRDCREISIDWVGQRTRGLNIVTILKETIFKSKNIVSLVDEFSYPSEGIGRLSEKMKEEIEKNGGSVITESKVIRINHKENRVISIELDNKKRVAGDLFISSIPLSDLVYSFIPRVKGNIQKLADKLGYRDEVQVTLFIAKKHITRDTWIYIHPKEIPYMRLMEMDNWSSKLDPQGKTAVVFEIACNQGDKIWNSGDKELIKLVSNSFVNEFGLIGKKDIVGGYVHRVEKEYPVYHLGYREDTKSIKDHLKRFSNLQIIGRNGVFRYNNMDHSIEMGLYAAWNIIEGGSKYDIEGVNIEREYLEEKKIENIEDETLEETK